MTFLKKGHFLLIDIIAQMQHLLEKKNISRELIGFTVKEKAMSDSFSKKTIILDMYYSLVVLMARVKYKCHIKYAY